ncbi:transcriptional regulator CynR [Pantoea sp. 1.19]|uniref:transcriptional regulator CynR n=1 Tax=Pantoea sp. 1.19 TaxID=1925589 RepID=UPI000948D92B|nr:transcriptional regulator CynR [Pantoea sp. 1.19]
MLSRALHYFLAVADQQSFTRAAAALYVSQPALSQQIRLLEQQLAATLFDRSGRQIRLTPAGEAYLPYARRALAQLQQGERSLRELDDLRRGALRLAFPPTLTASLIGPLVAEYHRAWPGITLTLEEQSQEQSAQRLRHGELDLAFGYAGGEHPQLNQQPLYEETLALVVNDRHPLAAATPCPLRALHDLPLALLDRSFASRMEIDRCLQRHGIEPQIQLESNAVSSLIALVSHGELATLLPASLAVDRPMLCVRPLMPGVLMRTVVLLRAPQSPPSAAALALIDLLTHHLAQRALRPPGH